MERAIWSGKVRARLVLSRFLVVMGCIDVVVGIDDEVVADLRVVMGRFSWLVGKWEWLAGGVGLSGPVVDVGLWAGSAIGREGVGCGRGGPVWVLTCRKE